MSTKVALGSDTLPGPKFWPVKIAPFCLFEICLSLAVHA